jgi:lipid-binding SYLF domain-containing protein
MKTLTRRAGTFLVALGLVASPAYTGEGIEEEAKRARKAGEVLDSIMASPDKEIPSDLLAKAHAVAVIPNMVKGAFIAGGRFGKGLVSQRNEDGSWGTPAFIDIGGGSFGLQIGVEATDLILVFTKPEGLREMLKDNLKLGVDAAAVAGPVGRHVGAGSNVTFDSPIYAYSRNKGVFAGVSVDGSVLTIDDSSNQKVYGEKVTGTDIIVQKSVALSEITRPFVEALSRHARGPATE